MADSSVLKERSKDWMEVNREQFLMVMNIGMKAVITKSLESTGEKMAPYLLRLVRKDIMERVNAGELDPAELVKAYNDSVEECRKKLEKKNPGNIYAGTGFKKDPLIVELEHSEKKAKPKSSTRSGIKEITGGGKLSAGFIEFKENEL